MTLFAALPNALSSARLAIAPTLPLVYALAPRPEADWIVFGLFCAAMATDFLDGWIARRFDLGSEFGRMLDPIADKAVVLTALFLWAALWSADPARDGLDLTAFAPAALILLRELIVSGLREHLGGAALRVSALAKAKTALQSIAIGALLLDQALRAHGGDDLTIAALALLWSATALTLWTGADYARAAMREMRARARGGSKE